MRLQVAILLLAGLAVASAALPKHPFFASYNQATAKGHDEGYESTKLCLQNTHTCFSDVPDQPLGFLDYTISLQCCAKGYHRRPEDDMMAFAPQGSAGWCIVDQTLMEVEVADTSTNIWTTFEAQCYLGASHECNLEDCENSVMHVEGVVLWEEDAPVVFDSNFVPAVGCAPVDSDGKRTKKDKSIKSNADWAKAVGALRGITPPTTKASAQYNGGSTQSTYYEAPSAFIYYGIATTYSSSGKLIGTGPWEYAIPFVFGPGDFNAIQASAVGNRKVYTPHGIQTYVHSSKGYHSK